MGKIRVLHVDDHPAYSDRIREILESEFEWLGAVTHPDALLEKARELSPDVVLLDIGLPGRSGLELARELREVSPSVRIIMLTVHADPAYVEEAFRAGAHGYVIKSVAHSEIATAVRTVFLGNTYVSPLLVARGFSVPP